MTKWTAADYQRITEFCWRYDYNGYKPEVVELPNGDGVADTGKRYAHLALKYNLDLHPVLEAYFWRGMAEAAGVWAAHSRLGLGTRFSDAALDPSACALRVLEYPPGTGSAAHTDFDIFTVNLWRSHPDLLRTPHGDVGPVHFGELYNDFARHVTTPDTHWVDPHPTEYQYSLVFFALPSHDSVISSTGQRVGDWLQERIARSRTYRG